MTVFVRRLVYHFNSDVGSRLFSKCKLCSVVFEVVEGLHLNQIFSSFFFFLHMSSNNRPRRQGEVCVLTIIRVGRVILINAVSANWCESLQLHGEGGDA